MVNHASWVAHRFIRLHVVCMHSNDKGTNMHNEQHCLLQGRDKAAVRMIGHTAYINSRLGE